MHAVRVTVICDELLRIEYAPDGRFCDHPSLFAIHGPSGAGEDAGRAVHTLSARAGGRVLVVETARVRLEYTPDGRPPHAGNMHALIKHASPPAGVPVRDGRVLWTPGAANRHNLGGTLETLDGVRGSVSTGDGLLARDGWHVVDDSQQHLLVDSWAAPRDRFDLSRNTDWYLFAYGEDYRAAFNALRAIAGGAPMPRRCALGSWYSRYWAYTSEEFRGIVAEYRTHGFPLDIMVLDMDWHRDGWTGWSWNRELVPDAEDLLAWMHEEGLAVTLNLHPADGVGAHEDRYGAFMRALGREPDGSHVPFDAADRAYMTALFEQVHAPLELPEGRGERAGVDFWWVDWQQDRFTRSLPGLTNLRWLNHLYFQHTARPRPGRSPRRGMSFSRWAGWGDHRYPVHFSGDAHTGWKMLAFQVPFTVQAGNVGCFYWSHDIGGHFGPRLEETTARWVQFGALSAALRLHSARSSVLDRRPWTYEPRFCESMRRAFELRCRLMPYIATAARESERSMVPLLRPMYLSCSCDQRAYETPQQYLLGEDVLAAPIVTPGIGERCVSTQRVWFPCGCAGEGVHAEFRKPVAVSRSRAVPEHHAESESWYDFFTGEHHHGGHEVIVAADIDTIPVFVRGGAPVPMQPVEQRMTGTIETLVVRLFPGASGTTTRRELYEDDGDTVAHTQGVFAVTPLIARWLDAPDVGTGDRRVLELEVGPVTGTFEGQPAERPIVLELGGVAWAGDASVDSVAIESEHDPSISAGLARVRVPARDIRQKTLFRLAFEPADRPAIVERVRRDHLQAAFGSNVLGGVLRHALVSAYSQTPEDDPQSRARVLAIGGGIALSQTDGHVRLVDSLGLIDDGQVRVRVVDVGGEAHVERASTSFAFDTGPGMRSRTIAVPNDALPQSPLGRRAERVVEAMFSIDAVAMSVRSVVRARLEPLSKWCVAAPFDWDWRWNIEDHTYEPEAGLPDSKAWYRGADGRHITWQRAQASPVWAVDFTRTSPDRRALGFGWTRVFSPARQRARLFIEAAGDKTQVLLNKHCVFSQSGFDSDAAALEFVDCELQAGENHILVKAAEGGGGWGFTLALECEQAPTERSPLDAS